MNKQIKVMIISVIFIIPLAIALCGLFTIPIISNNNSIYEMKSPSTSAISATWTPLSDPGIGNRFSGGMVYDDTRNCIYLFGGLEGSGCSHTAKNTLYKYDVAGNSWSLLSPSGTPPDARADFGMVLDTANDQLIIFGGDDGDVSVFGDTWTYDISGNSWHNKNPSSPPSARRFTKMVYDSNQGQVILFGGDDGSPSSQTWTYNPNTNVWTNKNPSGSIPGRQEHVMIYDAQNDQVIVFGGSSGSNLDDTWAYNIQSNSWSNLNPSNKPTGRIDAGFSYINGTDIAVLFAGKTSVATQETWAYNITSNNWEDITPVSSPLIRYFHQMCFDSQGRQVFMYGGTDGCDRRIDFYKLTSTSFAIQSGDQNPPDDSTPPNAPVLEEITPNPDTDGTIILNWNDISNADNYTIYRSNSQITQIDGTLTNLSTTTNSYYTDIIGTDGTYYYTVIAENRAGASSIAIPVSVSVSLGGRNAPVIIPGFPLDIVLIGSFISIIVLYKLTKRRLHF
ncbi:MAG: hypothetical protein JW891_16610 [Candidatus Lokiarchaeota archaeon]|nr:hypothetical protein [Candidatus Lokiarchaeota archaeon]